MTAPQRITGSTGWSTHPCMRWSTAARRRRAHGPAAAAQPQRTQLCARCERWPRHGTGWWRGTQPDWWACTGSRWPAAAARSPGRCDGHWMFWRQLRVNIGNIYTLIQVYKIRTVGHAPHLRRRIWPSASSRANLRDWRRSGITERHTNNYNNDQMLKSFNFITVLATGKIQYAYVCVLCVICSGRTKIYGVLCFMNIAFEAHNAYIQICTSTYNMRLSNQHYIWW